MTRRTHGIDIRYRPASYFWAADRHVTLLSDIRGAERRKMYLHALEQGKTDELDPELQKCALRNDVRQDLGRIHPSFMGGDYLPEAGPREVEIARITIASITQDVTSVYARQAGGRIHYRVVDEYNGDTLDGKSVRTSLRPLSLGQLSDFFLRSWNLLNCLDCNFEESGYDRDEVMGFIVDASSSFYAEFGALVMARVDDWLDSVRRDDE